MLSRAQLLNQSGYGWGPPNLMLAVDVISGLAKGT